MITLIKFIVLADGVTQSNSSHSEPSSLPPALQQDLELRLRLNLEGIYDKYTLFVECIRTSIKSKGISVSELRAFLMSQSAFDHEDQDFKLFSDRKDELERAVEVNQIFNFLNSGCASFLDFKIFEKIINKYDLNKDQEELTYPEHLENYINKHTISEFLDINPALVKYTEASEKVLLKFNIKQTCKLARVKSLSGAVAEKMKWNPSAVLIYDIDKGCVIVTLLIPASLANAVFIGKELFSDSEKADFLQMNILWLKCNGFTYDFSDAGDVNPQTPPGQVLLHILCLSHVVIIRNTSLSPSH